MKIQLSLYLILIAFFALTSCISYKQGLMLTDIESIDNEQFDIQTDNYKIQPNDRIEVELFIQGGEALVDPYFRPGNEINTNNLINNRRFLQYLVNYDGTVTLPKIGECVLSNLTLKEAEKLLVEKYNDYYEDIFLQVRFMNKRVVVFGGEVSSVIPLLHENMKLSEVLAQYGNLGTEIKSQNIRVVRGGKVFIADLTTFSSFEKSNITLENGDIIYVEPVIRPFARSVRDYGPVLSIFTGLLSVTALIITVVSQP